MGKLIVGGAAVYLGYRLSNATIQTLADSTRFSERSISGRIKQRPIVSRLCRSRQIERAASEEFDVVVIGGELRVSKAALSLAVSGLKTLIIDTEDFNSTQTAGDSNCPGEIGTFSFLKSLSTDPGLSASDRLLAMSEATADFSYLRTAPHLCEVRRTAVMVPDLLRCVLEFTANKLADIVVNKPPKFTSRLSLTNCSAPAWYQPSCPGSVLSYDLTEVLPHHQRLNLSLVLTAVHHGAAAINQSLVQSVERGGEGLTVGLEDKLTGRLIQVRTKKLVKLTRAAREGREKTHCFQVPEELSQPGRGFSLPEEDIVVGSGQACVGSCASQGEAWERLRSSIRKVRVLRKSEVTSLPAQPREEVAWSVETCEGSSSCHRLLSPVGQSGETLVLGSHGWSPLLATHIQSRYGLSQTDSLLLASRYGDQAMEVARVASREGRLAAEVGQACEYELCVTLTDLCGRLRLAGEEDIKFAAALMQQHLGWSSAQRDRQVRQSLTWLASWDQLQSWKRTSLQPDDIELNDKKFSKSQIEKFKKMSGKDGTISHGDFEGHLEGGDSPCGGRPLSEAQLDGVLRAVDLDQNGQYSQSEFLSLVKRIHILTPEEVIGDHVHDMKIINRDVKS